MKKYICIVVFLCLNFFLSASIDFNIEKVNTFAYCQSFFSNATMLVEEPYMYALTSYGLEIYEIQNNGQLQKISELPIKKSWEFVKRDNFLYVGSIVISHFDPAPLYVYQVDVSDKYNPFITQTLEYDNFSEAIIPQIVGNYFIAETHWGADYIYTLPELGLYGIIEEWNMYLQPLDDTMCINFIEASIFDLYDNTDITNLQYMTTVNMYYVHGGYSPRLFKIINDTICVVSGQSAVSFWNISNPEQWEYVSHYVPDVHLQIGTNLSIYENYIILSRFDGLELIDITDIHNPQSLYFCEFDNDSDVEYYIVSNNEYIYIGAGMSGIGIYYLENEEISFVENYYEYPSLLSSHIFSNYLFLQSSQGIYLFDITDPFQPIELPTCLNNAPLRSLVGYDSLIVVYDYDEITIKIYNITDPTNPILRNTIDYLTFIEWCYSTINFDYSEPQVMYLFNETNGNIIKCDISEPGDCPILFTYNIINTNSDFIVRDGFGYIFTPYTYPQHLYVIGGLYNNEPEIVNTINNFTQFVDYTPFLRRCGEYLCLRSSSFIENTKLYSLDDPLNPELACILDRPSTNSWPNVYDNFLFTKTHNLSFVYDLNECNGDTLQHIDYFEGLFMMYGFDFYDVGDTHYLFVTEQSSIGVYEFNYSYGVDDEPELENEPIICSPNPFSTSTTIHFNLTTESTENTEIKIYNVKGQLIKTITSFPNPSLGMIEAVWDGRDVTGKEVSTGVYLYKISNKDDYVGKLVKLQ